MNKIKYIISQLKKHLICLHFKILNRKSMNKKRKICIYNNGIKISSRTQIQKIEHFPDNLSNNLTVNKIKTRRSLIKILITM